MVRNIRLGIGENNAEDELVLFVVRSSYDNPLHLLAGPVSDIKANVESPLAPGRNVFDIGLCGGASARGLDAGDRNRLGTRIAKRKRHGNRLFAWLGLHIAEGRLPCEAGPRRGDHEGHEEKNPAHPPVVPLPPRHLNQNLLVACVPHKTGLRRGRPPGHSRVRMPTNISCYRFAELKDLKPLRGQLAGFCRERGLKGTILLSTEGINLFVAGQREDVDALVEKIRGISGLEALAPKYSESAHQPFTRMLVRIKKEIIAFGVEGINPAVRTSPKLAAADLRQWLDEGRPVTLLDTRNDYEVKLGTFEGALDLGIGNFRDFPEAVGRLPEEMKSQPVVMFCTGGIRCEKAGPYMESAGFEQIYQLDGGILKYFEECGGTHYRGECFVFDQRVGVDPALQETGSTQCYVCQSPLTPDEQNDPRYVPGASCPHCFRTPEEKMCLSIQAREAAMQAIAAPLPGSTPYDNLRPVLIPAAYDRRTLREFLNGVFPHHAPEKWERVCAAGHFQTPDGTTVAADQAVRAGERYEYRMSGVVEPAVNLAIRILHEDEALIVVDKPSPLPMHPGGRFNKNTLQYFLAHAFAPQRPRPAHRLDANTSGLVIWTRTRHFAKLLQPQFAAGEVSKVYLVRTLGHPAEDTFSCRARIGTAPGALGSRQVDEANGRDAQTDFRVLRRDPDGTALLEARPLTGRTNQIRIHLWQLGLPVSGDPAYLPNGSLGETMTLAPTAPPLCLHSWKLSLRHPLTGQPVAWEATPPSWAGFSISG